MSRRGVKGKKGGRGEEGGSEVRMQKEAGRRRNVKDCGKVKRGKRMGREGA